MDPFLCHFMRPKTSDKDFLEQFEKYRQHVKVRGLYYDKHSKHKEKCDYKTQTL